MRASHVLLFFLPLVACGGGSSSSDSTPSKPSAPAQGSKPVAQGDSAARATSSSSGGGEGGSSAAPKAAAEEKQGPRVRFAGTGGRAHWVGDLPAAKWLSVQADAALQCEHGGAMDLRDPSLLVGADAGLANVVIEVEVAGAKPAPPGEPIEVDQLGCTFLPHVTVVPVGATLHYKNSDPFTHNVNVAPRRNDAMNVMVDGGGHRAATYPDSDQIQLKCDIHPWMSGWVYVSDAAVHALSSVDGSFVLPALPEGSHKVSCWHESLGTASGTLVVGADGSIAELELALGKKKPR
jgi:plastocyanin